MPCIGRTLSQRSARSMSIEDDTITETAIEVRSALALVASLPLFRDLEPELLSEIANEIEWFSLPGGTTLFEIDEPADADATKDESRQLEGDLLPDWYDDWLEIERERLRQLRVHALEHLGEHALRRGRFGAAIDRALAAIAADPLRESAHRLLIRAYIAEGNTFTNSLASGGRDPEAESRARRRHFRSSSNTRSASAAISKRRSGIWYTLPAGPRESAS